MNEIFQYHKSDLCILYGADIKNYLLNDYTLTFHEEGYSSKCSSEMLVIFMGGGSDGGNELH